MITDCRQLENATGRPDEAKRRSGYARFITDIDWCRNIVAVFLGPACDFSTD